ncbi:hypothetical protein L585_12860 [Pantoea ananatis BRT175]|uniref:hypothetical protein n=1 Tax=Pantoea ananas TaxID=553 RepID=UPI0003B1B527|nr:hypothetical protein [Pantoea ananatis]ERM13563.1 hypothetical protein L585_12860 [Pantoea ananatis BRT175]
MLTTACLLQAVLLFLFVENRADAAVVRMLRVAAQAGQILLLRIPVADNDIAVADRRFCAALSVSATTGSTYGQCAEVA